MNTRESGKYETIQFSRAFRLNQILDSHNSFPPFFFFICEAEDDDRRRVILANEQAFMGSSPII